MNSDSPLPRSLDLAARIDLLVANELSNADRVALIQQLEAEPDGWRQCALAFLEDQAWDVVLNLTAMAPAIAVVPPPNLAARRRVVPTRLARLALAAGLASTVAGVSFWGGLVVTNRSAQVEVAGHPLEPGLDRPETAAKVARAHDPDNNATLRANTQDDAVAALPINSDSEPPILTATAVIEDWLKQEPATIPDYVKAQWERRGYQVAEAHRLVGLVDETGRQVTIPVNEVAVDYVGRQPL